MVKSRNRRTRPISERFWRFVDKTPGQGIGDCWLWTGYIRPNGYAMIGLGRRVDGHEYAHRVSFALSQGRPPQPGYDVCHHCDIRACVRPDHLFEGTRKENLADMQAKGRRRQADVRGERHPNAKLTTEQVLRIRAFARGGRSIAAEFGISYSLVKQIRQGCAWKHLPFTCPKANEFSRSKKGRGP